MKKPIPTFQSGREAEEFVADADWTEYDLSSVRLVRVERKPKTRSISLRRSEEL